MSGGALPSELTAVEEPFIERLVGLGWDHLAGHKHDPSVTERTSFRDVVLLPRLHAALRRINADAAGDPWLDDGRVIQAANALVHAGTGALIEANRSTTDLLLTGTTVDGLATMDGGRGQTIRFIDWDYPERNDFLVVSQFRVDEPVGQAHKFVVPDLVLFVNGIPLVVIECKSPYVANPKQSAIEQLQRYANQRDHVHDTEGNERLFHFNQFVVATWFDRALVGTFTSDPEHYAEWKYRPDGGDPDGAAELSSQEVLIDGMLAPATLLDVVRNFTLFMGVGAKTVRVVCRYQQYRGVAKAIERLTTGATRTEDGEHDRRGGIIWHTQGSGKSLTMVFLVRKMRTIPALRRFKVVVVTDRTDLQRQLGETAALTGETVEIGTSAARVKDLLARTGPGLVFAMIQKYRADDAGIDDEDNDDIGPDGDTFPVLNESDDILVLVDEAHRSQASRLHANLLKSLPNAARIGFTGTPIIMGARKRTHEIFGAFIDQYTIRESEADGATVPILYEGRTTKGAVTEGRDLDEVFEDLFVERSPEEIDAIKKRWAIKGNVLEAPKMIAAKARDMLRHYVDVVMPNGFKAQVVATSRLAAVRYRDAFIAARDELVAEIDALEPELLTTEVLDAVDEQPPRIARLLRAYQNYDIIRALDFAPVISGSHNDDPALVAWSDPATQRATIAEFKRPLVDMPKEPGQPPEHTVAFLIVKSMLLTGFDAPVEQVLYLDRSIKEAELLQAIARVNRTAERKHTGYVVDYYGVGEHLKVALAAYSADDVEGILASITDELPKLEARHQRVRNLFVARGIEQFVTDSDREACVAALADERTRASFEVLLKQFLTTLDVVMPRPEALPFIRDAKTFGLIQLLARRTYRDTDDFDVNDYGEKVRQLIADHVLALGVEQKIPPVSITAGDFATKVAALSSPRAKASEMEHAIRYHVRKHFDEDPTYFAKLSERLDEILTKLADQWDQLVLALGDLTEDVVGGRQADESGLDPTTEAPFYGLLEREVRTAREVDVLPDDVARTIRAVTVALTAHIRGEIVAVGFWQNAHAQDTLRRWVVQHLDSQMVDGTDLFALDRVGVLADQVVEVARANRAVLSALA